MGEGEGGRDGDGKVPGAPLKALGQVGCPTDFGGLRDPRLDLGDPFQEGSRSSLQNPSEKQHGRLLLAAAYGRHLTSSEV